MLANRDHVEVRHALMYRAFDHFLEGPRRDWSTELKELYDGIASSGEEARSRAAERRVEGTSPSLDLDSYVGLYSHPLYGSLTVTRDGDGLRADWGPGQPGALGHWNYDTFELSFDARWRGTSLITFTLGTDGTVAGARMGAIDLRRAAKPSNRGT